MSDHQWLHMYLPAVGHGESFDGRNNIIYRFYSIVLLQSLQSASKIMPRAGHCRVYFSPFLGLEEHVVHGFGKCISL